MVHRSNSNNQLIIIKKVQFDQKGFMLLKA